MSILSLSTIARAFSKSNEDSLCLGSISIGHWLRRFSGICWVCFSSSFRSRFVHLEITMLVSMIGIFNWFMRLTSLSCNVTIESAPAILKPHSSLVILRIGQALYVLLSIMVPLLHCPTFRKTGWWQRRDITYTALLRDIRGS